MIDTYDALIRIERILARPAYLVPTATVPEAWQPALADLARWMARPDFDGELAVARVHQWVEDGQLDAERMFSALAVIATHPNVRNYLEASCNIALQESAALSRKGDMDTSLASIERHRGVLAFCMGRPSVALECFTRAFERERSPENMANVLAALVRLGDLTEADSLLATIRANFPQGFRVDLDCLVEVDDDLADLR